jgi:hypothetical protein
VLEVDLDAKTHRDDTTPNSTNADLPSTETTINNSAGSAAPQRDNTPLSSAQPNNLPPIYDASLSPSEQQTQAQLIDAAVDSRAPKRLKTQREDLNTTREVHHPLSRPTPDTRNNTNPAQPLAGTSDQNLNAPQSRDDGPEESLDEAQPPPSTNPIIHENIPPNTTADGLLKAHNCEPVIRNDDSLTRLPPSTRVGGYTRKRVADENTGPDGRGKLQPTQIQTGGGGSVDEQAENNSELVDGTPGRGAVGYALQEVLQHGRGPQQGTLEQQEGHTSDPYQHRQPQEIQNQGTQPGGATWQEARDGPPPRDISYLQNSRRSYSPHPNPRQVGQRLRVANSANLSQQTHPSPPRVGAFQNAVPQFQPPYDHSPNVPPRQGDRPVQDVHYTNVHPQPNPLQSNAQHTYSIPQSNPQYVYPTQHSGQPPLPNWTQKYPPQRGQFFQAGNSTNSLPQSGQDPNWQDGRTYQAVNPQAPQVSYPQVSLAHGNIPHSES